MKTNLIKIRRNLLQKVLGLFSLTALVFVFEACYGTPQDFGEDVEISGTVKSAKTGQTLQGIEVTLKNNDYFVITENDGKFSFFASPGQDYHMSFVDSKATKQVLYLSKDTVLKYNNNDFLNLEIKLNEKQGE